MMKTFTLATALMLAAALPALALDLNEARGAGLVGERPDGLIAAIAGTAEVKPLVERVNAGRMEKYREIAARNGTSVEAVQSLAGRELAAKAPAGSLVQDASGTWRRK